MANFKVGQRVRISPDMKYCIPKCRPLVGAETVITSERFEEFGEVGYRTAATDTIPNCIGVQEQYLIPLSDPKADEFIERIRKMKPYDEPVAPKHEGNRLVTLDEMLRNL